MPEADRTPEPVAAALPTPAPPPPPAISAATPPPPEFSEPIAVDPLERAPLVEEEPESGQMVLSGTESEPDPDSELLLDLDDLDTPAYLRQGRLMN
jgi:hypothetical protein